MLKRLFKKTPKASNNLNNITTDQLQRERVRLDHFLNQAQNELNDIEQNKADLFEKGRTSASQRHRESIARQIQRLDISARHRTQRVKVLSAQLQALEGLVSVKENQNLIQQMEVGSAISKLPIDQIQRLVEDATVAGRFQMEKFARVSQTLESAMDQMPDDHNEDLHSILEAMEDASMPLPAMPDVTANAESSRPAEPHIPAGHSYERPTL